MAHEQTKITHTKRGGGKDQDTPLLLHVEESDTVRLLQQETASASVEDSLAVGGLHLLGDLVLQVLDDDLTTQHQHNLNSFFFFFFVCAFPSYISGVHHFLGEIFCVCDRFFNPTIKVVTFRLRGWCVLGVFLLLAFTCLGHERQDLLSPCDEMHVCTD